MTEFAISSSKVKWVAASLGFDACGITSAEPVLEAERRLTAWLGRGFHGEMKYMEDFESRAKKFWESFPEAKSIIVVGVNYYSNGVVTARRAEGPTPVGQASAFAGRPSGQPPLDQPARPRNDSRYGRVARYAWGKDYHRLIGERLKVLHQRLEESAGRKIRAEICVDTKPLLERSLAQKAGLGFIGKQSQLLHPKFGPWLFLGELVTDLELKPDIPYLGSCGECRICIDACPTQAIHQEGGIDARRCVAYLTIEHRSEIPGSLKPLIGDWVFGCDICLQVCPYAAKGKETSWTELRPESGPGPFLDLTQLLEVPSNKAYERKFRQTAVLRAKRKQLSRNASIVLENLNSTPSPLPLEGGEDKGEGVGA